MSDGFDKCQTPGCDGDARYAAPGRSHITGCTHPLYADRDDLAAILLEPIAEELDAADELESATNFHDDQGLITGYLRGRAAGVGTKDGDSEPVHICGECADCLHDGNKCCGCYDNACCREVFR